MIILKSCNFITHLCLPYLNTPARHPPNLCFSKSLCLLPNPYPLPPPLEEGKGWGG